MGQKFVTTTNNHHRQQVLSPFIITPYLVASYRAPNRAFTALKVHSTLCKQ